MVANRRQSYNLTIELQLEGSPESTISRNTLDLKNPFFRFTGQPVQPPPGCNETSPSEDYWQQLDATNAAAAQQQNTLQINGQCGLLPNIQLNNNANLVGINTQPQMMQVNGISDGLILQNGAAINGNAQYVTGNGFVIPQASADMLLATNGSL